LKRYGTKAVSARSFATRTMRWMEAEVGMTHMEIKALEDASRSSTAWAEGYDGQTHYAGVLRALAPALLILATAAGLMLALL
jgi:VIT1/CCC1 family predicted Fe2+/Mn2+ transporter